ncbi:hypothetical protein GUJ93_ZPchr0013g37626 [Zizania palustris]|uniref:KIB1-4 beta-propeller domain-containing protein n=1 Tax=Zizania palustris TaxID=103762 RepID=A0A8J5WZA7_ZIZPA|nr:hypothetical protein GUJ93_ZPchr0013g37626 [Zizania palustris]
MATRRSLRIANRSCPAEREEHEEWRDWASLPVDMVGKIADLVLDDDLQGFIRLRAVCKPWMAATPNPAALGPQIDHRFHPRRWMMIIERHPAGGATLRRFLNIDTRKVIEVDLPWLATHTETVVVGSARAPEGMLVLRDELTLVVRLVNPLTRHVVDLPSLCTLAAQQLDGHSGPIPKEFRAGHKVEAAGFADRSTVVVYMRGIKAMAVAKPGDERWTRVEGFDRVLLSSFTFQSHFYCVVNNILNKVVMDPAGAAPPRLVAFAELHDRAVNMLSMVDDGGKLMLVCSTPQRCALLAHRQPRLRLYELVLELGTPTLRRVTDLGNDRAVFTGELGALLLPSIRYYHPSVTSNTMYFRFGPFQRYLGIQRMHTNNGSFTISYAPMPQDDQAATLVAHLLMCVTRVHRSA